MPAPETRSSESRTLLPIEHLPRPEAIARLRDRLTSLAGEGRCVCLVVEKLGIFCRGFAKLSEPELRTRFDWIARTRTNMTRLTLEGIAALYHEGRLEVTGADICCDVESREHTACDGWNQFDNARLEQVHLALTGNPVRIG